MQLNCDHPYVVGWSPDLNQWQFFGKANDYFDRTYYDVEREQYLSEDIRICGRLHSTITNYKLVPCGKCLSCRLRKAQSWTTRITAESSLYQDNYAVTLTYNDDHLHYVLHKDSNLLMPTLYYPDVQKFKKALLEDLRRDLGLVGVRFFCAGEYGAKNFRPHYHLILMNCPLPDLKFWSMSETSVPIFRSKYLEQFWPHGFVSVQYSNEAAAGYAARYTLKKIKDLGKDLGGLLPEFVHMSNRPGIGAKWCEQHRDEIIQNDAVYLNGKRLPVPPYFEDMAVQGSWDNMLKVAINAQKRSTNASERYFNFLRELTIPYEQWHDVQVSIVEDVGRLLVRPL